MAQAVLVRVQSRAQQETNGADTLVSFVLSEVCIPCPDGEIGRHVRFRGVCRKVCWFESSSGHRLNYYEPPNPWGVLFFWPFSKLQRPENPYKIYL